MGVGRHQRLGVEPPALRPSLPVAEPLGSQPEEGGDWKWLSLEQGSVPLSTADMAVLGTMGC